MAVLETAVILLGADGLASTAGLVYTVRRLAAWPKPPPKAPRVTVKLQPETVAAAAPNGSEPAGSTT